MSSDLSVLDAKCCAQSNWDAFTNESEASELHGKAYFELHNDFLPMLHAPAGTTGL